MTSFQLHVQTEANETNLDLVKTTNVLPRVQTHSFQICEKNIIFLLVVFLLVALNSENDEDDSHLKHRIIKIQNVYIDLIHFCVLFFQFLSSSIK